MDNIISTYFLHFSLVVSSFLVISNCSPTELSLERLLNQRIWDWKECIETSLFIQFIDNAAEITTFYYNLFKNLKILYDKFMYIVIVYVYNPQSFRSNDINLNQFVQKINFYLKVKAYPWTTLKVFSAMIQMDSRRQAEQIM